MALTINTGDYLKEQHIKVDGKDWTIKLPGAGTELRMSQQQRRMKLLDKKIADGTAEEADYDLYDKFETQMLGTFEDMFNDGTKENQSVKDWIENTPLAVIVASFEEIKRQAEETKTAENGSQS